jgi:hypothetical protein
MADPEHRAVKRGSLTSLVKFSDETYMVLHNEDITRKLLDSPPLPPPPWCQALIDALRSTPAPPLPWTAPTWGASFTDPDSEPIPYLEHRRGHRTAFIRALDPDHLLRHESECPRPTPPPEPDSDDSDWDSDDRDYAPAAVARPLQRTMLRRHHLFVAGRQSTLSALCGTSAATIPS